MPSCCSRSLATFQVAGSFDKSLRKLAKGATCQQLFCHCGRECSSRLEAMEVNVGNFHSNGKQALESSTSSNEGNKPREKEMSTTVFVNHAAIAWHESRKKWIGDQTRRPQRKTKDPIISWSTTYEELLSTPEPFAERIPLPEMVDFLVDIWHDEGLYD